MTKNGFVKFLNSCAIAAIILVVSCSSENKEQLSKDAVGANNRGVALMGQFNFEAARNVFQKLAEQYPENKEIHINLAIATLNRQYVGDEHAALAVLKQVLEKDRTNPRALYCAGLMELYIGRVDNAQTYFEEIIKADPQNAEALYFYGKTLIQLSRHQEAMDFFKRSIAADPYMLSAYYGLIMALRQQGERQEAQKTIEDFQQMKANPRSRLVEFKYTRMGKLAEVRTINQVKATAKQKPSGPLFHAVKRVSIDAQKARWSPQSVERSQSPGITVADINADTFPDLFMSGAITTDSGIGNAILLGTPELDKYTLDSEHPLSKVPAVNTALWGDLNDDGLIDVYLCRRGPNQLWIQGAEGKWQDVTEESQTANGQFNTVDGALFDADHDGDLDIFLVNADGPNELLNNNRTETLTFRPLAEEYGLEGNSTASKSIIVTDLDADRDTDLIVINQQPPHEVYLNQRLWQYLPATGFEQFSSTDIAAVLAGDVDTDGRIEIYSLNSNMILSRWQQDTSGVWQESTLAQEGKIKLQFSPYAGLALADGDGNGELDLFIGSSHGWLAASLAGSGFTPLFRSPVDKEESLIAWRVVHSPQGPFLLGWSPGKPPYVWSAGSGRYAFVSFTLSGLQDPDSTWRSNASGIGTRVSARVDSRWTVLDTFRSNSGPGQDLQPVTVGLGGAERIDFITLDWSDGVFQTELDLKAGSHKINETQRQISSCPVLFAWNGTSFEFVSDLLGVGGMGYAVGPGEYAEPRPYEHFLLPQGVLQPQKGQLLLKLSEPMEEATYLDNVRLLAYDLPPGWKMTLDERMGITGPSPSGRPFFYRQELLALQATNNRHEDVTATVLTRDLKAAPPGELDRRFIGRLKGDHILTLTFPQALDNFPGQAILLADGWVEYPYSQTNFAAWQAGVNYRAPSVEALTPEGDWLMIQKEFGYPAGMPRQMALPLPKLPEGVRTIRLSTNQEIYWDRVMIVFAEQCPDVQSYVLELESARLEQHGFPRRTNLAQRVPQYDFNTRRPLWDTRILEGYYTKFGHIEELMKDKDNALAIFGPGEGVHMEFKEPRNPLKQGWTRNFVLEAYGWCKDMDFYTLNGETLDPIPSGERKTDRSGDLHQRYNIRYLSYR